MQHADARTGLSLHKGDNVQLCERTGNHMLLGTQLLDSTQAVTQDGGTLKLQLLGASFIFSVSSRSSFFASPSNSEIACSISA